MFLKPVRSALLLALLSLSPALAQEEDKPAEAPKPPAETVSETTHTVTVGGRPLAYRALAGTMALADEAGKPKASMFYVAYLKEGKDPAERARRPLTFVWNGGPGSSAVWLHMGALGPKRVDVDAEGLAAAPPYRAVANPHTLLDVTDLVFVDPVSTGYSRPAPGEDAKQFHSVGKDVEWAGELVRLFITRHSRWGSPLFLLGESYGAVRVSALADYLQRRSNLYLNGVVLVSPALSMQTYLLGGVNDLPYLLSLPAYTATAWYHKKLPADLQADLRKALRESEEFVFGDYADALLRGAGLAPEKKRETAARLARLTGLPAEEIERQNLRIGRWAFAEKLLEKERRQVGILDSRYWGYPNYPAEETVAPGYTYSMGDPSSSRLDGVFGGAMNQYLREDLGVKTEARYEILSIPTAAAWDYSGNQNSYLFAGDSLRAAMTLNPDLKVFTAAGTYDLVTTALAIRYVLDHLDLAPDLRKNLTVAEYEAGHMMYMHEPSLAKLKRDLAAFYAGAVAER